MTLPPRPQRRGFLAGLRASFLTGLVVVGPVALTVWLITSVIEFVDSKVMPLIPGGIIPPQIFGIELSSLKLPGLGVAIFLVFTLTVGWIAKGYFGRRLIAWGETLVDRLPVVRSVYNGLKQIAETVFAQGNSSFSRACLVQYPRPGLWAVAFVSTETRGEIARKAAPDEPMLSVFLPTTPNPTSGFLLFVPEKDVVALDMSVEDAAKLIISAGLVTPEPEKHRSAKSRRRPASPPPEPRTPAEPDNR